MKESARKPEIRFSGLEDDWEHRKFADTFVMLQNNTLSRAELATDGGVARDVHYGDVLINYGECLPDISELPYIKDSSVVDKYSSSELENGDVIIADTAEDETVGKCTEILDTEGETVLSGLHTIPCHPKQRFARAYLGYFMNSSSYHDQLLPLMQGIKVTSISRSSLQDTTVCFPSSMEEQSKIGNLFLSIDNLIDLHQRLYSQILNIKKSMLKKMFPQNGEKVPEIRFSGFTDDWEQRKASDLFISVSDKGHPELPVLSATQESGMVIRDSTGINIFHDIENEKGYKRVLPGQFVIHLRSFQGGFAHSSVEGITSPAYTVFGFRNPEKQDDYFWKYIFSSKEFIKRLETVTYGIRDGRSISYDEFLTMDFVFPCYEEQRKISECLKELDDLIALHQRKLEQLQNIKKSCLEKMFVS